MATDTDEFVRVKKMRRTEKDRVGVGGRGVKKKKVSHEKVRKKGKDCKKRKSCSLADKGDGNKSSSFGKLFGENGAQLLLLLNPYSISHSHSFPRVMEDFMTGGKKP